jgi:c-di-GMP-binding flagellar brake protein YcgR
MGKGAHVVTNWEATLHDARSSSERRGSSRFPIEREIRYRVLNKKSNQEAGSGRTINISSSGILFTTEHMLLPGRTLEVAMSWPAHLNQNCPLKLVARGRVVRFESGRAAIEIQHYEFRTQGTQALTSAM